MNTRIGIGIIYDVVNSYMTNPSLKWLAFLFNEEIISCYLSCKDLFYRDNDNVTFTEFLFLSSKFENSYFCTFWMKPVETSFPLYGSLGHHQIFE